VYIAVVTIRVQETFIVVVHRNREIFFGVFLADYIFVEIFFYFSGLGNFFECNCRSAEMFTVLPNDVVAKFDTFRADKDVVGTLDERLSLTSCPAAEATNSFDFFIVRALGHYTVPVQK
jgi:hypothetical protein